MTSFFRRQSTRPKVLSQEKTIIVQIPDNSSQSIKIDRHSVAHDVVDQVVRNQLVLASKKPGTNVSDRQILNEILSKYKYSLYESNDKKVEKILPDNTNMWDLTNRLEKQKKDFKIIFKSPRGDPLPKQAQLVHTLQAIESPITTITRTLNELLKKDYIKGSTIEPQLQQILLLVTTQELYKVNIKSTNNDPSADTVVLDQLTQSFLRTEFGTDTAKIQPPMRESLCLNFNVLKTENSELNQWGFDVWKYSKVECVPLIVSILNYYNIIDLYKIDSKHLSSFLQEVIGHYQDNPYHNFFHAVDVTQTVFSLISSFGGFMYLTQMDIFVVLVSALCHDIDHPGLSNSYQVNALTDLALHWNDQVVLENHHVSLTFKLLNKEENNILSGLSRHEYQEFRKMMIDLILATDMASHFTFMSKFKQRMSVIETRPLDPNSYEDRYLVTTMFLKCSDISNVAKPWEYSKTWADRVSIESYAQGDREKKMGLPVAAFMDREVSTPEKNTANFIDFIAGPCFEALEQLLPDVSKCTLILRENRGRWERFNQKLDTDTPNQTTSTSSSSSSSTPMPVHSQSQPNIARPPFNSNEEKTDSPD